MPRRRRGRLANGLPWLGLLALVGALLGALLTFQAPQVPLSILQQIDPGSAPPLRAPGLPLGAIAGLAMGCATLLAPLGRRTALRLLRPGGHDAAWSLAAGGAVALAISSNADVTGDLLLHPDLHVPRWFLVDSRAGLLASVALLVGAATWGGRVSLRARPRHARRIARLAGACALVGALILFAAG